jgi:hypothetical protein
VQQVELVAVLALIAATWPAWRLPADRDEQDVLVGVWFRLLGDLDQSTVVAAVDALACDGREFAPQPGQVRRRAVALSQPAGLPDVDEAWAEVVAKVATVGRYRVPSWSHPAIRAAVDALGWGQVCSSSDLMADRAHFIRFYGKAHDRAEFARVMPPSVLALTSALAERLALGEAS